MSNRRDFLHGMGLGALVLGPLARLARAEANDSFPLRVFFLYTQAPPTMEDYVWGPDGPIGNLPSTATPLLGFKNKIIPLLGLVNSSGKFAHVHSSSPENILTGNTSPGGTYLPKNESFDEWLNKRLTVNGVVKHPSMRFKMRGAGSADFGVHWDSDGKRLPAHEELESLFRDFLSGVPASSSSMPAPGLKIVDEDKARRRQLFNSLRDDYSLFGSRLSPPEKRKIDQHIQSLAGLSNQLDLNSTDGQTPPVAREGCFLPSTDSNDSWVSRLRTAISIGVSAMACDRTRFVTFDCGGGFPEKVPFTWNNGVYGSTTVTLPANSHAMNHSSVRYDPPHNPINDLEALGVAGGKERVQGQHDNCKLMHAVFAQILAQMSAVKEGSGTLLDNALVIMIPETYNTRGHLWEEGRIFGSNPHSMESVPVMLAGGAGGRIKPGRIVNIGTVKRKMDLDGNYDRTVSLHSMSDLWTMVANLMGYGISHWGRPEWNRPGLKERLS